MKEVNHSFFWGCYDLYHLYRKRAGSEFNFNEIIMDEKRLTNLYLASLKDNVGVVRTMTASCTRFGLADTNLTEKIETLINLGISSAKNSIKSGNFDAMLGGYLQYDRKAGMEDTLDNLVESVIYISDFGVDVLYLDGFEDWEEFQNALIRVSRVSMLPLAQFFTMSEKDEKIIENYVNLYDQLELELLGIEIDVADLDRFDNFVLPGEIVTGIQFSDKSGLINEDMFPAMKNILSGSSATFISGGKGFHRDAWLAFRDFMGEEA